MPSTVNFNKRFNAPTRLAGGAQTNTGGVAPAVGKVAGLPSAAGLMGARSFVSDANSTSFAAHAVGGGNNPVPVYSDGTVWRLG